MDVLTKGIAIFVVFAVLQAGSIMGNTKDPEEAENNSLTPVRFGMNWVPQPDHGGYYQASVSGLYKECGLEVQIIPGSVRSSGRKKLLVGKLDFYMGGNVIAPFAMAARGLPIKVIAAHFQRAPQVIMSHPGRFDTFESLKGAKIFLSDGIFNSYFRLMVAKFGFRREQRRPYNLISFLSDLDSAHQGVVTAEPFAVEKQAGFKPKVHLLSRMSLTSYASLIETTDHMLSRSPDLVQCFVDASAKGWYIYLYGDNSLANAAIKKDNPDISEAQLQHAVAAMKEYGIVDSGDALLQGIGAMTHERMKAYFDKLVSAGILDEDIDYKKAYTLEFVNKRVGIELKKRLVH